LSAYADVDPAEWRFVRNECGRPEPMWNGKPPVRCNLSKTNGLVACVVTRDAEAGIDVEDIRRIDDPMELAGYAFSSAELADLKSLAADEQRTRFFEYWTLKEAYLKARGVGLSEPLDRFSFGVEGRTGQIRLTADSKPAIDWQFRLSRPLPDHVMAVAVRNPSGKAFRIVERWGIPLAG
jgi:4'-phosphopantetheinyl transferase